VLLQPEKPHGAVKWVRRWFVERHKAGAAVVTKP